jgi:hypothetical protein
MNAPPFLVNFSSLEEYLRALPIELQTIYGGEIGHLVAQQLPPIVSMRCLGALFGFSAQFIGTLFFHTERYYRLFQIKKGKKIRTIQAPRVALKVIQKWFGHHLASSLTFHESVFGFVSGRSTVQAAAVHCGAKWIYSVDIKDFFPSTSMQTVIIALMNVGYGRPGAELIAKLCCYKGALSQGSPASPILSNLTFKQIDEELFKLSRRYDIHFTRYADDIVFSGMNSFPSDIKDEIVSIVQSMGWMLSRNKEYYAERPGRLKVYGLLVSGQRPRLTKGYRNRIRAFTHLLAEGRISDKDVSRVKGHLSYANSIEAFDMSLGDDT